MCMSVLRVNSCLPCRLNPAEWRKRWEKSSRSFHFIYFRVSVRVPCSLRYHFLSIHIYYHRCQALLSLSVRSSYRSIFRRQNRRACVNEKAEWDIRAKNEANRKGKRSRGSEKERKRGGEGKENCVLILKRRALICCCSPLPFPPSSFRRDINEIKSRQCFITSW